MKRMIFSLGGVILLVVVLVVLALLNGTRASSDLPDEVENNGIVADPQMLLIPRWFLTSITLDGKEVEVPVGQQGITLQFLNGEQSNGTGGCNTFSASFQADYDGSLQFGPVVSTKMFCEGAMERENAYFEALSKVQQFEVAGGQLRLATQDGQTSLVFHMPPK